MVAGEELVEGWLWWCFAMIGDEGAEEQVCKGIRSV